MIKSLIKDTKSHRRFFKALNCTLGLVRVSWYKLGEITIFSRPESSFQVNHMYAFCIKVILLEHH